MSRANSVTKLGLIEVSRLVHDCIRRFGGIAPSLTEILRDVKRHRRYGNFQCRDIVQKIVNRNINKRRSVLKKEPDRLFRLHTWRRKRVCRVFREVFSKVNPSGGLGFTITWIRVDDHPGLTTSVRHGGYFNHRTISVSVVLFIHPHWHRQLGVVCEQMGRFFLSVYKLDGRWWAVEVKKGRGYTFYTVKVRLSKDEVLENQIDEILPFPPDSRVLGFSEPVVSSRHEARVG